MNWNQLQYVLVISQEKNITRAAQKLYISQPSLSLSLKSLEKELGCVLFNRKNGELLPTYAGILFCDWASSVLQSRQQLSDKLSDVSLNLRHQLRMGLSPHRSPIMLPDILEEFYKRSGNCDVQIVEESTYMLRNLLDEGELDFMIDVPHPDTLNYQSELLAREQILLALPDHLLTRIPTALIKDNGEFPCICLTSQLFLPFILLTENQVLGKMSRRILNACMLSPETCITCSNVETALTLAIRGLGAAFVPDILCRQKKAVPGIHYFFIENYHDTRQICLICRKNQYQNTHLKLMLQLFREYIPRQYGIPSAEKEG